MVVILRGLWYNISMLSKRGQASRNQVQLVCLDELVPQDNLLRRIDSAMDFGFIYDEVKDLYSKDNGRPSIDPVCLVKLCIINYLYGYNSMRRTIRECEVNMAYRWFLGYDISEKIPHFSTFGKNYMRRFEGTDLFERIFMRVLTEAIRYGFVDTKTAYIDGTHIKANANIHKNMKKIVQKEARSYDTLLRNEINADREAHGKKAFDDNDDNSPESHEITASASDPESGLFHKGEHRKCFAYNAQVACDKHGWILGTTLHSGNTHDSVAFEQLYKQIQENIRTPENVVADAGYKTPAVAKLLTENGSDGYMPYTRSKAKKGYMRKSEYAYDEYYDCYICPNDKILKYATTNKEGKREYKSDRKDCMGCPYKERCTHSKSGVKVITRHIWQEDLDRITENRYTDYGKEIYARRKETIERVFADAKEKHGMRYTRHNGLAKVRTQVWLTLMVMNLKRLAKLIGGIPGKVRKISTKAKDRAANLTNNILQPA